MTGRALVLALVALLPARLQAQTGWSVGPHFGLFLPQKQITFSAGGRVQEHNAVTIGLDGTLWLWRRLGLTGQLGAMRGGHLGVGFQGGPGPSYHLTYLTAGATAVVVHGATDVELGAGVGAAFVGGPAFAAVRRRAGLATLFTAEARAYLTDRVAVKGGLDVLVYQLRLQNPDGTPYSSCSPHEVLIRAGVSFDLFPRREEE